MIVLLFFSIVFQYLSMTQILPKVAGEFADPAYWRQFYSKRQSPFEWLVGLFVVCCVNHYAFRYGDYNELGSILEKYLKVSDKMLQIGCGNSKLAASVSCMFNTDCLLCSCMTMDTVTSTVSISTRRS